MDASTFLASKTFNRSLNLTPNLNSRASKWLHRMASSITTTTTTTTCNLRSPPPEDDREPGLPSDWRSFRASLVAGERTAGTTETMARQPILGDRWGHPLREPEKGCLLIATEKLDGVHIFERTVVLLVSTASPCPAGVILNRPSLMSIKEMKSTSFNIYDMFSDRPLFFGGPLKEGLFLVSSRRGGECGVFEEVVEGLYYGRKESVGCGAEMVKRNVVEAADFKFFDGYCGWETDQLKEEIEEGYWNVAACSLGVVEMSSSELWEEASGLFGKKKNLW
ncbi:hypothetical protein KSP39_PZI019794 [Platanthera zijinensis]|uniref:Uncharacterized protein n=1 Tax=Platanthera zijinensis TaxID=2320716 RepID=A0AAP0FXM9_9ASPA